jgi:hypothetical protein
MLDEQGIGVRFLSRAGIIAHKVQIQYIVAYFLKARTVESEKRSLLCNGYVACNNGVTFGNCVSCAVYAEAIEQYSLCHSDL